MPTYDYRCTSCAHEFEISRPISASRAADCPRCAAPAKQLFSPAGIVLKGSGFHNTDYRPSRGVEQTSEKPVCPAAKDGGSSGCASCPAAE